MLTQTLPHKAKLYEVLYKTVKNFGELEGGAKPWRIWVDSVKGHEDKLRIYSKENIKYICENLDQIEILQMLELKEEWNHFSSQDLTRFWNKLNEIQFAIDDPDSLFSEEGFNPIEKLILLICLKEKKKHLIYKGFNVTFLNLIEYIKRETPEMVNFSI